MAQATHEFGEWPLKRLMTEVCGSGHKSADDLTRAQATEAFERILAGEPDHTHPRGVLAREPLEAEHPRGARRVHRRDV